MPIPDSILPAERDHETEAETTHWLRCELVTAACNALLAQQLVCGKTCHWCSSKCPQLQAWLDVGGDE